MAAELKVRRMDRRQVIAASISKTVLVSIDGMVRTVYSTAVRSSRRSVPGGVLLEGLDELQEDEERSQSLLKLHCCCDCRFDLMCPFPRLETQKERPQDRKQLWSQLGFSASDSRQEQTVWVSNALVAQSFPLASISFRASEYIAGRAAVRYHGDCVTAGDDRIIIALRFDSRAVYRVSHVQ